VNLPTLYTALHLIGRWCDERWLKFEAIGAKSKLMTPFQGPC